MKDKFSIYYNKYEEDYLLSNKSLNIKCNHIEKEMSNKLRNFDEVRKIAISEGGFIKKEYRKYFYNILIKEYDNNQYNDIDQLQEVISTDCDRSVLFKIITDDLNLAKSVIFELKNYILGFFKKNNFKYYQGFNDLALYFYIFDSENYFILNLISKCFFLPYLDNSIKFDKILNILCDVIEIIDPKICKKLLEITNTQPYYALSWIITWFSHNNTNLLSQFRIIDYLIFSPPVTIYFLSGIIIIEEFKNIDCICDDEYSDMIIKKFQKLDLNNIDINKMILKTEETMKKVCIKNIISKHLEINHNFFINTNYKNKHVVYYYITAISIILFSIYLRTL